MGLKVKFLVALASALLSASVAAQDTSPVQIRAVAERPGYCYDVGKIFDTEILPAEKKREIEGLEASAKMGNDHSQYLIGTLYRLGEKHPANIYPKDYEKAKIYLGNAAIGGNYEAMAGMAEIELENRNFRDAMLWAQLFAHYTEIENSLNKQVGNQAYQAYLIQRIMQHTGKDKKLYSEQMFREDLAQFFAEHNEHIVVSRSQKTRKADALKYQACRQETAVKSESDIRIISSSIRSAGQMTSRKMPSPGYVMFLFMVDSKGKPVRTMTVDSLPDAGYAKALLNVAKRLKFNEVAGPEIRSAYVPLSFDDFSVALRKPDAKK